MEKEKLDKKMKEIIPLLKGLTFKEISDLFFEIERELQRTITI